MPVFDTKKMRYRAMPKFTPKGLPDVMIIFRGKFVGVEVKVPHFWKYTPDQKFIKEQIIANGGRYHLITSLEMMKKVMKGFYSDEFSKDENTLEDISFNDLDPV